MKIKELATLAKACRRMKLINTCTLDGKTILRQHLDLGGAAVFPLDGLQAITPETLLTIADVNEEAREKYMVETVQMTDTLEKLTADSQQDDIPAVLGKFVLKLLGYDLIPVIPKEGETLFLYADMIKPLKGLREPGWAVRWTGDGEDRQPVIIAMDGYLNVGAIAPAERWATPEAAQELVGVVQAVRQLALKNALKEQEQA